MTWDDGQSREYTTMGSDVRRKGSAMSAKRVPRGRGWYELLGDGALISAGTMALFTGVVLLVTGVIVRGSVPVWMELGSGILTLVAFVVGPVIAWLAHERALSLTAIGGAILAAPMAAVLFFAFVLLSTALGWILRSVNDADWFGPLIGVILAGTAFATLCVWLLFDAARDRIASPREHPRIDTARLAAVAIVVVYTVTVVVFALQPGAGEVIEALAFMLIAAVVGGSAVGMADLAERLLPRHEPNAPQDPVTAGPATAGESEIDAGGVQAGAPGAQSA